LINYVWLAAGLMALGGVLAATDRRYRSKEGSKAGAFAPTTEPAPGATQPAAP
jgi:hypothetical protein